MSFRTLRDIDVKGHRVFLRADLNVPIQAGTITDTTRIRETLPTLHHPARHAKPLNPGTNRMPHCPLHAVSSSVVVPGCILDLPSMPTG